jgi:hypothetical protein
LRGEREAADRFEAAGWTVRGLEASGDWLAFQPAQTEGIDGHYGPDEIETRPAVTLHVEVKRQERLRIPEWLEQAAAETPAGVPPVVVFRQSRGRWYACLPLDDLLGMLG